MTNSQKNLTIQLHGIVYSNKKLPLLEYTKKALSSLSLEDVLIISVQHLCSSTRALCEIFFNFLFNAKNYLYLASAIRQIQLL
ncbi:hypothetical protein RSOCI_00905 [Rhabdochlamydiaceae symbiont of Dictyostelium giganteum]